MQQLIFPGHYSIAIKFSAELFDNWQHLKSCRADSLALNMLLCVLEKKRIADIVWLRDDSAESLVSRLMSGAIGF